MSIWEVRGEKQRFTISQIMLWVAFDRGLRLADKRCFPCPNRAKWTEARDHLYEEIMEKGNYSIEQNHDTMKRVGQSGANNKLLQDTTLSSRRLFKAMRPTQCWIRPSYSLH